MLSTKKDNPNMAIANNITSRPSQDKKISNLFTFIFSFYKLMNCERELYYNINRIIVEIKNRIALSFDRDYYAVLDRLSLIKSDSKLLI